VFDAIAVVGIFTNNKRPAGNNKCENFFLELLVIRPTTASKNKE